ncbi:hypothetical protein [uncultured Vagococcus sp.]|nr:hypothetical protein [uncultured Vagococcus sp.]
MLSGKQIPINRFSAEPEAIQKVPTAEFETAFLHREQRKVANDGIIVS